MNESEEIFFKTNDFNFAIILYYFKLKLKNIIGTKTKKEFVFLDNGKINEIRMKYLNKELEVEPIELWNSMKTIKTLLYDKEIFKEDD